jgi:hypothetical protein
MVKEFEVLNRIEERQCLKRTTSRSRAKRKLATHKRITAEAKRRDDSIDRVCRRMNDGEDAPAWFKEVMYTLYPGGYPE